MTSALIIILREVLEAMLIVCILLAASSFLQLSKRWIGIAVLLGLVGALLYAFFFDNISDAFEGVGQEVTNASILFTTCVFLALYNLFAISRVKKHGLKLPASIGILALTCSIALSVTREGAEIYIYLSGYITSPEPLLPILLGGILGSGIGLSAGTLIYFSLKSLKRERSLYVCCGVLVLVAAGMASQGANYLMQADLLSSQLPLWDSSALIPETSVLGELLYALFAYEATPTASQVVIYLGIAAAMIVSMTTLTLSRASSSEGGLHHV